MPAPIPYMHGENDPGPGSHDEQPFDKGAQWVLGVLAVVMTLPFAAAIPLCAFVILREPRKTDLVIVVALLCAIGMTAGLGGAGIGMIRRARRARGATLPGRERP